jgi:hypothetical protein
MSNDFPDSGVDKKKSKKSSSKIDYASIIEGMDLDKNQKEYLKSRWLDQRNYSSRTTNYHKRYYVSTRVIIAAFSAIVAALIGLNAIADQWGFWRWVIFATTLIFSLIVTVATSVEDIFKFGERYRNSRRTVEQLKSEFWLFYLKSAPYDFASHREAFPSFVNKVENVVMADVEDFYATIVQSSLTSNISQFNNTLSQVTPKQPTPAKPATPGATTPATTPSPVPFPSPTTTSTNPATPAAKPVVVDGQASKPGQIAPVAQPEIKPATPQAPVKPPAPRIVQLPNSDNDKD